MNLRLYTLTSSVRPLQAQFHRYFSSTAAARHNTSSEPASSDFVPLDLPPTTPTNPNAPKKLLSELPATVFNDYYETQCPTEGQLAYANKFFTPSRHSPVKLWSASKFRTTPIESHEPEVCFLGRSNVGKSSLLNTIMGDEICYTSSKPGRTREMNAFGIGGTKGGESKIVLLDMPGYGHGGRAEWGEEIMKYLEKRKQLRRVFVLIDGHHGIKIFDRKIIRLLSEYNLPYQIVVAKIDKILAKQTGQLKSGVTERGIAALQTVHRKLRQSFAAMARDSHGPPPLGETLTCCAAVQRAPGDYIGISAIRWAIIKAAGYDANVDAEGNVIKPEKVKATTKKS